MVQPGRTKMQSNACCNHDACPSNMELCDSICSLHKCMADSAAPSESPVAAAPSSAILEGASPASRRFLASSSRARRLWCSSSRRHLSRHTSMPQLLLMADSLAQVDCSPCTPSSLQLLKQPALINQSMHKCSQSGHGEFLRRTEMF